MIVQELLFPNFETCATYEMYFRINQEDKRAYYAPEEHAVHMGSWQYLYADTYFNYFSVGRWRKYTRLDNLTLQLELKGSFHIQLVHKYAMNTDSYMNTFAERVCRLDERGTVELKIPLEKFDRGIVCFLLDSLEEEDNVFYGGRFVTDVDESALNRVDIAIDICTFKRESFVERNIALLNAEIIQNPRNPVNGHLEVFISDNGQTLDVPRLQSDCVHIFPNKNVGGAGGFARGMIEILDYQEKRPFSHVLVMDDDVLINTDAIVRTYRLLQFLKPEFAGKTVAGAMLRLDNRFIQHECGGWWDGNEVHPCKTFLDLINIDDVLRNEREDLPNYNAWWYSCIPIGKISNENLPLPIFIRFDDVEFGLRTGSDIITLGGICLWHEPFEYKYSSSMEYYHMRNGLIVDAFHRPGYDGKAAAGHMMQMIKSNLGRYRYTNCELILRAAEDFRKGPRFLLDSDGEALHKEIMAAADKFQPLKKLDVQFDEQTYLDSFKRERIRWRLLRLLTLNKMILPARGTNVVDATMCNTKDFAGRKRVLNYDVSGGRGFVSEYSLKRTLGMLLKARKAARALKQDHARVCEEYRQAQKELTSREFWNKYLNL